MPKYTGAILCLALCGCAHLEVRLENFMTPDRGTGSARLALGYVIENRILEHEGRSIGITHAHHPDSEAVILFCGGDDFHRSEEGAEALEALSLDADVVLFDYPGYGDTSGPPSVDSILDTAVTVYDSVFSHPGARDKKRVLYGFSMGGMVAAQLAEERRADGVVLEAVPPSVRRWADSRVPLALKPVIKIGVEPQLAGIDAVASLAHFRGKLLLLASHADEIVPARLASEMERRLRAAGRDVSLIRFPGRKHGAIHRAPAFAATLRHFIEEVRLLP